MFGAPFGHDHIAPPIGFPAVVEIVQEAQGMPMHVHLQEDWGFIDEPQRHGRAALDGKQRLWRKALGSGPVE